MDANNTSELTDDFLLGELNKRLTEKNNLLKSQAELLIELEGLNERLRDTERVKSGFLSNIRNEINNPLTSIIGLSHQISHGPGMDIEKLKRIATMISKEAFTLDFQLRNIFSAAEIEAGEITPQAAIVDIDELVRSQIEYFQSKAIQHSVSIIFENPEDRNFKTDGKLVQAIVMNILANAIEFSPPNKQVVVRCRIANGLLTLEVQDLGPGISMEERKYLFQRFRQLDTGSTKTHSGHGLGLSIVKEFTDALRGQIEINSEVGLQTTVTVTLPEFELSQLPEGFSFDGQEVLFGDEEIL
jgi:signal transduction histidine kinase